MGRRLRIPTLIDILAAQLGDLLKLNTPVTALTRAGTGWCVTASDGTAEFGAVAAFVCSQQASYMTGSIVRADGGQTKTIL